jgi:outer membrane lipoprotein-sorting protein
MLASVRYYSLFNKKLLYFLIFFIFNFGLLIADTKTNVIKKINGTSSITFEFIQNTNSKIENGNCILLFPNKLKCVYNDDKLKELIINNQMLAITQKRYQKNYYYPLGKSSFAKIINKKELIKLINLSEIETNADQIIFTNIDKKERKTLIFFEPNTLNLKGWKFTDRFNNNIEFLIKINTLNDKFKIKDFEIPKKD